MRKLFGEEGMGRLIAHRETDARTIYFQICQGPTLQQRLEQPMAVRTQEGYMAQVEGETDNWRLMEDHCRRANLPGLLPLQTAAVPGPSSAWTPPSAVNSGCCRALHEKATAA